ncbi:reprolysin-like metallopeptidase [Lacinutrix chionoecetis]
MKNFYFNWVFTLLLSALVITPIFSQNNKSLWTKTTQVETSKKQLMYRKSEPNKANFYKLNIEALKTELSTAPNRNTFTGVSNVIIDFPSAHGTFESYRVKEAPIMEAALQNQYPNIRTYLGKSINTPGKVIRFSITQQGLHTMSMSNKDGIEFIDPYTKNSDEYIVYAKKDLPVLNQQWECGVVDGEIIEENRNLDYSTFKNADDSMLRNFRLAVATTIEYSAFHWMAAGLTAADTEAAKRAAVMAAVVVTINRNNQVYERDLSITMTLVGNNNSIIFINSDNFSNDSAGALIGESQTEIDAAIGNANYDIGHTFSTGGGGLASLNSPCVTGNKARGITGLPAPVGDAYDIDFVAHELGHQFGAPHTFNGDAGNCAGGNRTASNAYEPGSGSTIMAYAGICAPQNVQNNSDAYFHQKSLQMIWDNVTIGNSTCANQTATGNSAPTSNAGADFTIPALTPYKLTGSSTDPDGTGTHTYTWEQYDLGPAGLPDETNTTGPLVRSFEGTDDPTRYVPRFESVLSNGGVSTTWEKLSSVNRNINFRLTVRDNGASGGQTAVDQMTATVNAGAGPFVVTSQNTNEIVWTPGDIETITWDVAGTTGNGVNTANVNILLSTDEGVTFSAIASNVPNNGAYNITVPNVEAPKCRIMVEGAGNIFYNVNDFFFAIGDYTYVTTPEVCNDFAFNLNQAIPFSDTTYSGYALQVNTSQQVDDVDVRIDITHPDNGQLFHAIRPAGQADIIRTSNGSCPGTANLDLIYDDEGTAVDCTNTTSGANTIPFNPLSAADGIDSQGQWAFFITDIVDDANTGTVNTVTLTICTAGTSEPVLSVDEFNLENSFAVYPNPNNGNFNIKFNSNSNKIGISVYDVRGRSVYDKSYINDSGTFDENINLGNVQSGLYLLNVNDGERTVTKKVIVQ